MKFKTILLGTAALALMAGQAFAQDAAQNPPKKHHHHAAAAAAAAASSVDARIDQLEREIQDLKAQEAAQQAAPAAPEDQVSGAQFEALQNQVYEQAAATNNGWWSNTKIGGRIYWDISNISASGKIKSISNSGVASSAYHTKSPEDGLNYDLKRFYLIVDHKFSDTYSANLTTDVTYDSSTKASQIFIKKAYLQAAFDPLFTVRVGAADMPWVPFVEGIYGYRYVENTVADRMKYATSADWGAHILGSTPVGDATLAYQFSAVNGFGYKAAPIGGGVNRSKGVDFEGRVSLTWNGFVAAVGGYHGKLGGDVEDQTKQVHCNGGTGSWDVTCHSANRFDALLAYTDDDLRIGAEYFSAKDYKSVTSSSKTPFDSTNGYSGFASYQFVPDWRVFGRYDWVRPTGALQSPNKLHTDKARNQYYNFGVSYSPTSQLDFALVYKHDSFDNVAASDSEFTGFNCLNTAHPAVSQGACNTATYNEIGVFGQVNF